MEEIELSGGAISAPVKVGNTVRRIAGAWTPTVHALLDYLVTNKFHKVPRPLGIDEKGREILSYLEGEAAHRPWPSILLRDEGLEQVARLLRTYHDLVSGFVPPKDALWRIGQASPKTGEIIRHGDLGPWNTLWQDDQIVGLLDWDFAEPGQRITDVAQMAWYFVPLRLEEGWRKAGFASRPDFRKRVEVICQAYGKFEVVEVLREVDRLQRSDLELTKRLGGNGVHPWNLFFDRGGMKIIQDENAWLQAEML